MKLKVQFVIAIFFVLVVYIPAVEAQADLTFSGGNGTPLSITLQRAITYTINNTQCAASGPIFVFDEAGNPFGSGALITGSITYSFNGGAAQPITNTNSGVIAADVTPNDIFVYGSLAGVSSGSTVVLSAGTVTTTANVGAAPPANGSFATFLTNGNGVRCSANGVAAASPTAATVSIRGRVMTATGRGIKNVRLTLTDSNGQVRTASTSSFGYYRFLDVQAGETYILSAVGKHYTFSQPIRVLNINEDTDTVNFIAH